MAISTVTVSRYLGAGGEEIGLELAERLGFDYMDDQIITRFAERANVTPELAAEAEQRQSLIARILDALPAGAIAYGEQAYELPRRSELEDVIRDIVRETGQRGGVVLVAHGAAHALGASAGVLRILVTATEEHQVLRLVSSGLSEDDARGAVNGADGARADYLNRMYGVTEAPDQYDLCINTDHLEPAAAAEIALAFAESYS